MTTAATSTTILDVAEKLFATHGFAATSLRRVITEAGVNLAAVHYHFGSKEALIGAVLARRIEPLNEERLQLLADLKARRGSPLKTRDLPAVIEALVGPALRMRTSRKRDGEHLLRLAGRVITDPNPKIQRLFMSNFTRVAREFMAAIAEIRPELSPTELHWRCHFMIGAMSHTLCERGSLEVFCEGQREPDDPEEVITRLVAFVCGGFKAPSSDTGPSSRRGRTP